MAATAVLLFVLNKLFDCLGTVWCLNKDEINRGDVSFVTGPKAADSTEAHSRLPWLSSYHSEF